MGLLWPFFPRLRCSGFLAIIIAILLFHSSSLVHASPLGQLKSVAKFSNGFGVNSRAISSNNGIMFTVRESGTVAICELSFSTDLTLIAAASVTCETLYNGLNDTVDISKADHAWSFYAKIDDEVYEIEASIKFDPSTSSLKKLELCFSSTCSSLVRTPETCNCEPSTFSSSITSSSEPEGFAFAFPSNPGGSSCSSS